MPLIELYQNVNMLKGESWLVRPWPLIELYQNVNISGRGYGQGRLEPLIELYQNVNDNYFKIKQFRKNL